IIPTAKKVEVITYDEMLELASAGAKVMQSRSMEVAKKFQVPLLIRSSFTFAPGTLVKEADMELEEVVVTGVTHDENQVKVTIPNVPDIPGVAAHIFGALARKNINVDMIIQSAAEGGINDISFTVRKEDLSPARSVMESIRKKFKSQTAVFQPDVAKLSIVGIGMRSHSGVAARMFKALARSGINIEMISTSEIKVSCVVKRENAVRGVKALAKEFGLNN
ncbi:MAG TPA: ACT domain-containing protein, partial [bacterium]|nr:ACT domain-containing protein [bacterium]